MDPTADQLAGVADLFGALTRQELTRALSELAFKRGSDIEDPDGLIEDALRSYHLVAVEGDDGNLLAPGPAAFPELPDGAEDLPHIMDVPDRDVDRERVARRARERFRESAVQAVSDGDVAAIERLLDVSYELESWGVVDVSEERERLRDALS